MYTNENQMVSGDTTELMVLSPFAPAFVILDYYGKLNDATLDVTKRVTETGLVSFPDTYCSATLNQVEDTVLVRVEHHYVAPTAPDPLPDGYYKFSTTHYWSVNYAGGAIDGVWKFKFIRSSGQLDANFFDGGYDFENLKLMYRPDGNSAWTPVPYERSGSPYSATLTTLDLQPGQYCFAIADAGVSVNSFDAVRLNLYPNPATSTLTLRTDASRAEKAVIFDSIGHKVRTLKVSDDIQEINVNNLPSGNYVVVLYHKGKSVARTMFVKM
jgi:hypothetical protein